MALSLGALSGGASCTADGLAVAVSALRGGIRGRPCLLPTAHRFSTLGRISQWSLTSAAAARTTNGITVADRAPPKLAPVTVNATHGVVGDSADQALLMFGGFLSADEKARVARRAVFDMDVDWLAAVA